MTGRQFAKWRLPSQDQTSLIGTVREWSAYGYRIHRCYEEGLVDESGLKKGKNPIGKWRGLWSWVQSEEDIAKMFEPGGFHDRSRMIALIVPEGMVVFDIDEDPGKGYSAAKTLPAFCEQFGIETDRQGFPIGVPVVRTPSGGYHLYFTLPNGMIAKNWTAVSGKFVVPGIDLRTSGGGIALIPPSVRQNGTRYEWARWHAEVPPCNKKMIEALTPPVRETVVGEHRRYVPSADGLHPYMEAVLRNTVEKLESTGTGGRNAALNEASLTLAQWVAGGEISDAEAKAAIRGTRVYAELCREDGKAQCEATLKSGWQKGLQEPKNVPPPSPEFDMSRYNSRELNAHFETLLKEEPERIAPSPLVEELRADERAKQLQWVDHWNGGRSIEGTRAAMLLSALADRENSAANFRVRDTSDGNGIILMCAYREPATGGMLGTEELWLPASGGERGWWLSNMRRPFARFLHLPQRL